MNKVLTLLSLVSFWSLSAMQPVDRTTQGLERHLQALSARNIPTNPTLAVLNPLAASAFTKQTRLMQDELNSYTVEQRAKFFLHPKNILRSIEYYPNEVHLFKMITSTEYQNGTPFDFATRVNGTSSVLSAIGVGKLRLAAWVINQGRDQTEYKEADKLTLWKAAVLQNNLAFAALTLCKHPRLSIEKTPFAKNVLEQAMANSECTWCDKTKDAFRKLAKLS